MSNNEHQKITDSVTQANVSVVAASPAMALSNMYQTAAHTTGIMFENAVNAQNNQFITAQTVTSQGIKQLYSLDTVSAAITIAQMLNSSKG